MKENREGGKESGKGRENRISRKGGGVKRRGKNEGEKEKRNVNKEKGREGGKLRRNRVGKKDREGERWRRKEKARV